MSLADFPAPIISNLFTITGSVPFFSEGIVSIISILIITLQETTPTAIRTLERMHSFVVNVFILKIFFIRYVVKHEIAHTNM